MSTATTVAASTLAAPLVDGPLVALSIVARTSLSLLLTAPPAPFGVSLQEPMAVLLPQALVVPALPRGNPRISIGEGALWYDDRRVSITRWFASSAVTRGCLPRDWAAEAAIERLLGQWRALVGRGDGLTPYGDDVLSGALLGLRATAHPAAEGLADEVGTADLERATTPLSAKLLRAALAGWCIPEVARVVGALADGSPAQPARSRLLAVGHSSGRGLLAGLTMVLDPLGCAAAA